MAILKHTAEKSSNLANPFNYLKYQHDEHTGKLITDDNGTPLPRTNYLMDSLNCQAPATFQIECIKLNKTLGKNDAYGDIKTHHFILSFDPRDVSDHGLTMAKAQELGIEVAKKFFAGHQTLVCTHDDGNNHSGNIHVHIVINSVKKYSVPKQDWMEKKCEYTEGMKFRASLAMMNAAKNYVMEMCTREKLYQTDLLSPASEKISDREYRRAKEGQSKLEARNREITNAGLKPRKSKFETELGELRSTIKRIAARATSEDEFKKILLEKYKIEVTESRGKWGYRLPTHSRTIRARRLGTTYEKEAICAEIESVKKMIDITKSDKAARSSSYENALYHINVKRASETLNYMTEHGISGVEDLANRITETAQKVSEGYREIDHTRAKIKEIQNVIKNEAIYYATGKTYSGLRTARNPGAYHNLNRTEITRHEAARSFLKAMYPDGNIPTIKDLQAQKKLLEDSLGESERELTSSNARLRELRTVQQNLSSMIHSQPNKINREPENERD